jgi:DNA polymerase-1
MTPIGLAVRLGMEQEAAAKLIEQYFVAYPKVKEYLDGNAARTLRIGKLHTPIVRIRRFWGASAMTRRERNEVGRQAKNFPLQGACADGLQLALNPLWKRRDECPGAVPVPAVHNEIFVEVEEDEAQQVQAWLKEVMVEEWRGGSTIPCLEVRACQWRSRRGFAKYGLDGQAGD